MQGVQFAQIVLLEAILIIQGLLRVQCAALDFFSIFPPVRRLVWLVLYIPMQILPECRAAGAVI